MPRDAFVLVAAPDHEAGDVLQEDQRNAPLRAEFDEMRALLRGLGKQHSVVGDDAHRRAHDLGEARHQRLAEAGLELVEFRSVDHPRDHLADVVGRAQVRRHDAQDLVVFIGGRRAVEKGGC